MLAKNIRILVYFIQQHKFQNISSYVKVTFKISCPVFYAAEKNVRWNPRQLSIKRVL